MSAESGQSTVEYVALLVVALVVFASGAFILSGGGIADAVVAQVRRAICIAGGGVCGDQARAPCVVAARSRTSEASARLAFVRLSGSRTEMREHRSDGGVVVTLASRAGAGLQASVGARLGLGAMSLGASIGGIVEGRTGRGRVWRLPGEAEADALMRSLTAQLARRNPRAAGSVLLDLRGVAPPPPPDETFGEQGLAAGLRARLGRAGIELEAEDLLGSRADRATGEQTLTLRRRDEISAGAAALGAGVIGVTRGEERYALRLDAIGRPLEIAVIELKSLNAGARIPAALGAAFDAHGTPPRRGRLTVLDRRLDLIDAANLAAAGAFVRALREPRLRIGDAAAISQALRERLEHHGSARALLYDLAVRRREAQAEASLGPGGGGGASVTRESLRLVAASTRDRGGPWRRSGDCLPTARRS